MGIEPTYPAWKAGVLPLNYTCEKDERFISAQSRNRTNDTRIFSPLLYQLSYLGISLSKRNSNFFRFISDINNFTRFLHFCQGKF